MPYGESFAWISMVLTRKSARGRGLGTALLRHCLGTLEKQGRTALLDATRDGERIYRQLGFEPLFGLHRWEGLAPSASASAPGDARPLPSQAIDIANAAFGASRTAILLDFVMREPRIAAMSDDGSASLFARNGRRATQLGPLTAAAESDAITLLDQALERCAGSVFIDVADHAAATTSYLEHQGFSRQRPFLRMARGGEPWPGSITNTIAIAGPEFG